MIYTGPIDEFFDYQFGELPYRSLKFEFQKVNKEFYQEVGTVNYPNNNDFTRITEMKYLTGQRIAGSSICFEYPKAFSDKNKEIRYYPIPQKENNVLYKKYLSEVDKLNSIYFCGRLAEYKYYNMDQIIVRSLMMSRGVN